MGDDDPNENSDFHWYYDVNEDEVMEMKYKK